MPKDYSKFVKPGKKTLKEGDFVVIEGLKFMINKIHSRGRVMLKQVK